ASLAAARLLLVPAGPPPHGGAVRRARRDDPRATQPGAAAHLDRDRVDGDLRDALDLRGGLPVYSGVRHVTSPRTFRDHRPRGSASAPHRRVPRAAAVLRARDPGPRVA